MADEKLCLKWNDFQEVVLASFGELRVDNDFTDVTLACEDQSIKAHRVILALVLSSKGFLKPIHIHSL